MCHKIKHVHLLFKSIVVLGGGGDMNMSRIIGPGVCSLELVYLDHLVTAAFLDVYNIN